MKKIDVEITGVAPLLQHRYPLEDTGENATKSKKKVYIPSEDAAKAMYTDKEGNAVVPSEHILGALIRGGVKFKYEGRITYMQIIKAGILVHPDMCPLLNKEGEQFKTYDEIDIRPVVIQRARIARSRPQFNDWKVKFTIEIFDENDIAPSVLKEILEHAGGRCGIGDFRPRFGRFQVTSWQVQEE